MNTRTRDRVLRVSEHTNYMPTNLATTHEPQYLLGLHTPSPVLGGDVTSTGSRRSISRRRIGVPEEIARQLTFQDLLNEQLHTQPSNKRTGGRPKSLPPQALQRVLQLHESGLGYRRITGVLRASGITTTPWSVRRAVLGLAPYERDITIDVGS